MNVDVATYISQLLYEHDCVIIPDFGGFISNYQAASIDYAQGYLHPPAKSITFNNSLTLNDGLLINYIARKEFISYEESRNQIEAFAQQCKKTLQQKEILAIPNVGKLYNDVEHNLQFLPDASNFLIDSYGLPKLQYYPILHTQTTLSTQVDKEELTTNTKQKTRKSSAEKELVSTPVKKLKPLKVKSSKDDDASLLRFMPYAAAITFLFFVSFLGWNIYNNNDNLNISSTNKEETKQGIEDLDYNNEETTASIVSISESLSINQVATKGERTFGEESPNMNEEDSTISDLSDDELAALIDKAIEEEGDDDLESDNGEFKGMTEKEKETKLSAVNETLFSVYAKEYTIVVGCFGEITNAKSLKKRLDKDGLDTELERHGKYHRVGVKVLCEPKDLTKNLQSIRKKYTKFAWVL